MGKPTVTVEEGTLQGATHKDIHNDEFYSFTGIPYAEPPLNELRFKDPKPPKPWQGVKDATKEGNSCYCVQYAIDTNKLTDVPTGSEDCLYLNVYTHHLNDTNLKPVMFFIHGGGFISGSSTREMFGPEILMIEDIVLVTINYRLGALGFLCIDDLNIGNAGLKDIVQALKWVQKNIQKFSGDPNNVTIFGESAGSAAVHYLLLSPLVKGLFHRAILQSGNALNFWARGVNHNSQLLSKTLGYEDDIPENILQFLQKQSVEKIFDGQTDIGDHFEPNKKRIFSPVIEPPSDTAFITEDPLDIIRNGNYNHVPLIIGYTSKEGITGMILKYLGKNVKIEYHDQTNYVPYLLEYEENSDAYNETVKKITEYYFKKSHPDTDDHNALYTLLTDLLFARSIQSGIKHHAKTAKHPIYFYKMTVDTDLNLVKKALEKVTGKEIDGVAHLDDLCYLFMTTVTPEILVDSPEYVALRRFTKLWTNFAKHGNPTPAEDGLIPIIWRPVDQDNLHYLEKGIELEMKTNPDLERMQFWDEIFSHVPHY